MSGQLHAAATQFLGCESVRLFVSVCNLLCNVVEILRAELLEYKELHLVLVRLLSSH